eukprot:s12812_g1.t1
MAAAVKQKIKQHIAKTYAASDPEVNECVHAVDTLNKPGLADMLRDGVQRLRRLDPGNATLHRIPVANVPDLPSAQEPWTGFLAVWQLGLEAIKGRSKMIAVLEICFSILDTFYSDQRSPLNIHFEHPGCLDRELQEKCRLMDGDLCLDNFRFLQVYTGVAVAPEQLEDKEALAEEQQETAALNLFSVKLEREVKLWERYQQSFKEFNAGQKDAKSSFRREQDAKLKDWATIRK